MPNSMPNISVVMSTYNRADGMLQRAIDSVLAQSYKDFELIIVDDASTGDTPMTIEKYMQLDKRIVYRRLGVNSGSDTHPKNVGVSLAVGNYIAYLDDDNEWTSYHLEVLMKAMENDPDLDVAYCDSILYFPKEQKREPAPAIARDFDGQFLLNRNYIDTSQVLHKREAIIQVGGWDEALPKFVDWNLWVRMLKAGRTFRRVPIIATNYYVHMDTKSQKIQTNSWFDEALGMTMFEPTFSPSGCYVHLPYLGALDKALMRPEEVQPKVAVYTITYDRLDYTKRMADSLKHSTKYPFMWCVFDNGSTDGTVDWIVKETKYTSGATTNKGISFASNHLLDMIEENLQPQIIIKADNDVLFMTYGWLEHMVDLWKRNHLLYMSPYPEGLMHNPGGGQRIGTSYIGKYYVEVANHVGGLVAAIDAKAYKHFRFSDKFLHGNQDREASEAFKKLRYMPCYIPQIRVQHMDTTSGQYEKYPEYFERRKIEKTTQASI